MATTPKLGLTIPAQDGSDDVALWPELAAQGLLDLENLLILSSDSRVPSDGQDKYPQGPSLMPATTAQPWPFANNGAVFTLKQGTTLYQFLMSGGGLNRPIVKFRTMSLTGQGPWINVAGVGTPSAMATGEITLTPPAGGGTVVGTIVFPSGRFSTPPRVQLTPVTTVPDGVSVSLNSAPTAGNVQVALNRSSATGTSIQWTAVEGLG